MYAPELKLMSAVAELSDMRSKFRVTGTLC